MMDPAASRAISPARRHLGGFAALRALSRRDPGGILPACLEATLLIPVCDGADHLEFSVPRAYAYLEKRFGRSFEILIVPNNCASPGGDDRTAEVANALEARFPVVRQIRIPPDQPHGKGAALREGAYASRGRHVFFTDADLPYDLEFFDEAVRQLDAGADLVTGNRRLPGSRLEAPFELLRFAWKRHRVGAAFNRITRLMLGLHTTDTQAGIKAMSRRLAAAAFSRVSCPGFFFDLELFLTARAQGYRAVELPVTLTLRSENSTTFLVRELLVGLAWLVRIAWRDRRGLYGTTAEGLAPAEPRPALGTGDGGDA